MARERKTIDEFDIQGDYGDGYESVTCEATWWAAWKAVKEYRVNEPGIPFRVKKRRIRKSTLTRDQIDAHYRDVVLANSYMLDEHQRKRELRAAKATC